MNKDPFKEYIKQTTESGGKSSQISFNSPGGVFFTIDLMINEECPVITGSGIMIGDNIKEVLNSYEKGL